MPALRHRKFNRLFRLSYTKKNIKQKIRIKSRKKIESNLYLLKRRVAAYYGFNRYNDLKRHVGHPSFLANLETRADVVLFRLHWATSIFEARDMIRKGWLWIGSKIVTNPHQLLPLNTVFSLISCRRNAIVNNLPHLLETSLAKKFFYRVRRRKAPVWKYKSLNVITRLKARPYLKKFWMRWLYTPAHIFADHGLLMGSIVEWPTYPYNFIPYKNLEALGQYLKKVY